MNLIKSPISQLIKQHAIPAFTVFRHGSFSANRQSKTLSKLLSGKTKSKKGIWKSFDEGPKLPTLTSLTNPTSQGKSSIRRVHVLNKLFMRYITDYMSTDDTYSGYGLEISHVKMTNDFKLLNVYWIARGDESDEKLESILSKSAGLLRHNLSQLRLMGEVPVIKFVKDKTYVKAAEVENLLRIADFGDDFVPSHPFQRVKNDFLRNESQPNDDYPEMTHNILGLNQSEIMNRVKVNMTKTRQAWEKYEIQLRNEVGDAEKKNTVNGNETERKASIIRLKEEEFEAFLRQRKREKRSRERKTRMTVHNDDFEEDDGNQFEDKDIFDVSENPQ
ncbi:putative ribosome-binding factor A, mitochondrial [Pseudolycoriella hygida]|uniref:Ribosome-binding factor A, mitochondrial n=1 Tax=Pseudolycoriella hygida TaxID=35572 RepID=A0A9Q0RVD1_9DIPT|nr:putative ribosome-binding factor A, mitochondrial [Pseudolycoriella hygida]